MKVFDIINIPFGFLMRWFNEITGNYLFALFLFAIVMKLVMLPLSIKQQKNQIKQAELRPLEQAIRKRYAGRNDKVTQQKVQQEVLDLYQQQGYSPLSGCLPLLIQFPIIISLYNVIREPLTYICRVSADGVAKIIEFLGGVGYITAPTGGFNAKEQIGIVNALKSLNTADLASLSSIEGVDKVSELNFSLFGGAFDLSQTPSINRLSWLWLIPLFIFVSSFLQMKITRKFMPQQGAAAAGSDAAASMKIMDFTMPLMSVFFSFMFSGAVGVYWIYQNILGIGQTVLLAKLMPLPTFTEEDYKAAERQLNGKQKKSTAPRDPNAPKPRSLHHIDDDDDPIPPSPKEPEETKEPNPDAPKLKDDEQEKYRNK